MLKGVATGKIKKPALILIYGPDGIGKSTFGAEAPNPIFIGSEDGTSNLNTSRFTGLKTFREIQGKVKELLSEEHDFKSVVIDSLDWLEPLVWKEVMSLDPKKPDVIEEAFGGYGKWVAKANSIWKELMEDLQHLREEKKMNVIIIAHSHVKTFTDPSKPLPYDRYMLKLNDKAAAVWREFVDCVLFVNEEVLTATANRGDRKAKAYGDGKRVMFTERRPSFDAKNRYGLPFELPLGWKFFEDAMNAGEPDSIDNIMADLRDLYVSLPKETADKMTTSIAEANKDISKLINIRNHARTLAEGAQQ